LPFTAAGVDRNGEPRSIACFPEGTERLVAAIEGDAAFILESLDPGASMVNPSLSHGQFVGDQFAAHLRGLRPGTSVLAGAAFLEGDVVLAETLRKIADTGTPVPGLQDTNFGGFLNWSISDGRVAFVALSRPAPASEIRGICTWDGASIARLPDGGTLVPGTDGSRKFRSYAQVSMSGNEVAFMGSNGLDIRYDLFRTRIGADPVAGVELAIGFSQLDPPPIAGFSLRNGYAAGWFSQASVTSVYLASLPADARAIEMVADQSTDVAEGAGKFTRFASSTALDVDAAGPIVAFHGFGEDGQQGIYVTRRGGSIERVADRSVGVPQGRGVFRAFGGAAVDGTDVAFCGQDDGLAFRNVGVSQCGRLRQAGRRPRKDHRRAQHGRSRRRRRLRAAQQRRCLLRRRL
jgi:hypothetical protein